jgi:hypothetical protein
MKRLIYHPTVALTTLYLAELLSRSDFGLSGTLFVLATRSVSRLVSAWRNDAI